MSDVVSYPVSSRTFVPLHVASTPEQGRTTDRATRKDAMRCSSCSMRPMCMPQGLTPEELQRIEALICPSRTIRQGETIFRTNDPFESIYAVRAGSFKTVVMHRDPGSGHAATLTIQAPVICETCVRAMARQLGLRP